MYNSYPKYHNLYKYHICFYFLQDVLPLQLEIYYFAKFLEYYFLKSLP